jgi:hypothetical protein
MELGATSISAFTDKVTHLIANDHGGAKYMVSAVAALNQIAIYDALLQVCVRKEDSDHAAFVDHGELSGLATRGRR